MIPASVLAHIPNVPVDWMVIGLFAIFLIVVTLRMGTRVPLALALSLPLVAFIVDAIPSTALLSSLHQSSNPLVQLAIATGVFVVLYIVIFRALGGGFMKSALPLTAILASLAATIIAVVFFNEILGENTVWHFGSQMQTIFGAAYRLWWLLASFLVLAFIRG